MKRIHSHPIYILESTSRYLILLLFPILRALITTILWYQKGSFTAWLSGAWFDLIIIGIILGLGIYQWFSYTFCYDNYGIYVYKGIILRQVRYIAYANLTAISLEVPWYYYPFHVVRLKADTDGGTPLNADFAVTTKLDIAETVLLYGNAALNRTNQLKRYYIPSNFYIAIFSLLTSNSLTGVLYVAASISKSGDIFGQDIEDKIVTGFTHIASLLAFGLPPAAAIIAYTILGCWLFSFVMNLFNHLRFEASRSGGILDVKVGLFTRRQFSIAVKRINCMMIRQSLMTKMLGLFSVFIQCTGYGKVQNELSVLMPAGEQRELISNLTMLLPEIPVAKRQIKPKLINLSRFLIPPLALISVVCAAGIAAAYFFPDFSSSMIALLVIAEIPCVWWLGVKVFAFFFTGIGVSEDVITLYYTYAYKVMTCSIPRNKISKITTSQTLFQISTKCCDVIFYPYGEKQARHKVLNLNLPEVRKLLKLTDEDLGVIPEKKFTLWKA